MWYNEKVISNQACPGGFLYTIQPGDTFYTLARRYGITVDALRQANPGVDPRQLQVGQRICIPVAPEPRPCPEGFLYTIQAGDTLFRLANRYDITVESIIAANPGIDPNRLQVGQQVCIPAVPVPRACALLLRPREEGPAPDSGGTVWIKQEEDIVRVAITAANLPDPPAGTDEYSALLSWGRTTVDVPLTKVPGEPGLWAGQIDQRFPPEFLTIGAIDIFPGPVMGAAVEECRWEAL